MRSISIDELMSPAELGALFNKTPGTLANERSSGKGVPFVKVGGRVFYRTKDIQAFIERNVRNSTCEAAA